MRSFNDILRGENLPFFDKAVKFYTDLANRMVARQVTCSAVVCTLDQFGLVEMTELIGSTGGILIMGEEFSSDLFMANVKALFESSRSLQGVV